MYFYHIYVHFSANLITKTDELSKIEEGQVKRFLIA